MLKENVPNDNLIHDVYIIDIIRGDTILYNIFEDVIAIQWLIHEIKNNFIYSPPSKAIEKTQVYKI